MNFCLLDDWTSDLIGSVQNFKCCDINVMQDKIKEQLCKPLLSGVGSHKKPGNSTMQLSDRRFTLSQDEILT